ncbi:uncharacterized protein LOC144358467, partial [Saccoglossus kowalevskii]
SIDSDAYDHIAATYCLLAERKLRRLHAEKVAGPKHPSTKTKAKPNLEPLALSPRKQMAPTSLESPADDFVMSSTHVVPHPVTQPITIPVPQMSPLSHSSSLEDECGSPISGSPRRGLLSRDHLTIVPRHGRSIVKEGVSVLMVSCNSETVIHRH